MWQNHVEPNINHSRVFLHTLKPVWRETLNRLYNYFIPFYTSGLSANLDKRLLSAHSKQTQHSMLNTVSLDANFDSHPAFLPAGPRFLLPTGGSGNVGGITDICLH